MELSAAGTPGRSDLDPVCREWAEPAQASCRGHWGIIACGLGLGLEDRSGVTTDTC